VSAAAGFARFLYDFVVGDDPLVAVGVVAAIGLTALAGEDGFWILPLAVLALLAVSVARAARR
jgi:hypothetical protein